MDIDPQGVLTTQRYMGKIRDTKAIRWIEAMYGYGQRRKKGIFGTDY